MYVVGRRSRRIQRTKVSRCAASWTGGERGRQARGREEGRYGHRCIGAYGDGVSSAGEKEKVKCKYV